MAIGHLESVSRHHHLSDASSQQRCSQDVQRYRPLVGRQNPAAGRLDWRLNVNATSVEFGADASGQLQDARRHRMRSTSTAIASDGRGIGGDCGSVGVGGIGGVGVGVAENVVIIVVTPVHIARLQDAAARVGRVGKEVLASSGAVSRV